MLSELLDIAQLLPGAMMPLGKPTKMSKFESSRQRADGLIPVNIGENGYIGGNKTSRTISN